MNFSILGCLELMILLLTLFIYILNPNMFNKIKLNWTRAQRNFWAHGGIHVCLTLLSQVISSLICFLNFSFFSIILATNSWSDTLSLKKRLYLTFSLFCQSQARLKPKRCLDGFIFTLNKIIIIIIKPLFCPIWIL